MQRSGALGKEGWGGKVKLFEAMGLCEECGMSLKTSGNINRHIVTKHVCWRCEVCGRRPNHSRQMQPHYIVVFRYLPTFAVHLSLLGMEVSMCNQYVVLNL